MWVFETIFAFRFWSLRCYLSMNSFQCWRNSHLICMNSFTGEGIPLLPSVFLLESTILTKKVQICGNFSTPLTQKFTIQTLRSFVIINLLVGICVKEEQLLKKAWFDHYLDWRIQLSWLILEIMSPKIFNFTF